MRPTHVRRLLAGLAVPTALALVLVACSTPAPEPYSKSVSIDSFQTTATVTEEDSTPIADCTAFGMTDRMRYTSTLFATTDGAEDVIFVPEHHVNASGKDLSAAAWNHDLLIYAHGFIDPSDTTPFTDLIIEPEFARTRDQLLCAGYALAASSFAAKGYAIQEGVEDTHLLNAVFSDYYEEPARTYLLGSSMGGLLVTALAETFPARYDGGMPTCAPVGGSLLEFNYIDNERVLFDHYLPSPTGSYLGGDVLNPADPPPANLATLIASAVAGNPTGFDSLENTWLSIASLGGTPFPTPLTMPAIQTPAAYGLTAAMLGVPAQLMPMISQYALGSTLRYQVVGAADVLVRGSGSPFDNTATTYTDLSDLPPTTKSWTDLTGDPAYAPALPALAYAAQYYQPTGDTSVPLLTLHTLIDPDVPLHHEYVYAALAAIHPGTDLQSYVVMGIVQSDLRAEVALLFPGVTLPAASPFGHCNFAPSDLAAGLAILVNHVEHGAPWPTTPAEGLPPSFAALPTLPTP